MFYKDIGYLARENNSIDSLRKPKITYSFEKVYCNVKSIGQSEFYQAQVAGLKPEIKIEIKLVDIDGVTHFKFNDILYKILRTYRLEDKIELTLTALVLKNE